jgi:hypothetical protein
MHLDEALEQSEMKQGSFVLMLGRNKEDQRLSAMRAMGTHGLAIIVL